MGQANIFRIRQIVINIFAVITFLLISFSTAHSNSINDTVKITINYPATNNAIPITVMKNTRFTITIASNPSTGYSWALDGKLNETILKSNGSKYFAPPNQADSQLTGQGGIEVWTFTATGHGKQVVNLKYHRPWEKDVRPVKIQILHVTVQ